MGLKVLPRVGIEIEFALDVNVLKAKLDENNIEYLFIANRRWATPTSPTLEDAATESVEHATPEIIPSEAARRRRTSLATTLVVKPDKSVGLLDGWELNFPPTYDWESIARVLDILQECDPVFPEKAALHVHVSSYALSQYNIEQLYEYYYKNQEAILAEANTVGLYVDLNAALPENPAEVVTRKTNLNIKYSMRRHRTIEHRIYKSTMNIDEVKWCVNHTLGIFNKAIQTIELVKP